MYIITNELAVLRHEDERAHGERPLCKVSLLLQASWKATPKEPLGKTIEHLPY